jgi:hypothetical protein
MRNIRAAAAAASVAPSRTVPVPAAADGGMSAAPKLPLDELVNRIALDIQAGVFGPGTWLKQVDLEARYACTRIDLRRALDRLAANRLVEHVHNRGYHVYEADSRVYAELHDIRTVLELRAAESFQRSPGLLFDEIDRAFAFDFLQPEMRIVIGGSDGGPVIDTHGTTSLETCPDGGKTRVVAP